MNFAPYQDTNPETERALSPPPPPSSPGARSVGRTKSPRPFSPPPPNSHQNQTSYFPPSARSGGGAYRNIDHNPADRGRIREDNYGGGGREEEAEGGFSISAFQTSLPLRMDYEAALAYLLLPPAGGVLLLLLEHKSDYVRFHAWQGSMLFTGVFVLHMLLAWSAVLSWMLFAVDLAAMAYLARRAYRDVETLDHYEVPFLGRLANSFVDDE